MGLKIQGTALSGTARYGPINLSALGTYGSSAVSWTATVPANTNVTVQTAITTSTAAPGSGDYSTISSGGSIPGLESGQALASCYLWILVTMTTTVAGTTPEMTAMTYSLQAPQIADRLLIKLLPGLRCPIAPVVVEYDAAAGSLAGEYGDVQDFIASYTPTGYTTPHPNVNEHISMTASATASRIQINFINSQLFENISLSASVAASLIHVNDLNT